MKLERYLPLWSNSKNRHGKHMSKNLAKYTFFTLAFVLIRYNIRDVEEV